MIISLAFLTIYIYVYELHLRPGVIFTPIRTLKQGTSLRGHILFLIGKENQDLFSDKIILR